MSNGGADIYMILLRPSRVPVSGEAAAEAFQGQVLIESLRWNLHNENERKAAEAREDSFQRTKSLVDQSGSRELRLKYAKKDMDRAMDRADEEFAATDPDDFDSALKFYRKDLKRITRDHDDEVAQILGKERRDRRSAEQREEDERAARRESKIQEAERNRNFEITFTKRVDIASTQMLNSMKAGDIFPSGTLTIHKRSATAADGTSLVFSIQKIRLLDYQLQVAVTDTMTEMMEEWTCEFGALAYVYKNPPSHSSHSGTVQAAVKSATQGTARTFTMKSIGSPL